MIADRRTINNRVNSYRLKSGEITLSTITVGTDKCFMGSMYRRIFRYLPEHRTLYSYIIEGNHYINISVVKGLFK